jgi:hypothetical protein
LDFSSFSSTFWITFKHIHMPVVFKLCTGVKIPELMSSLRPVTGNGLDGMRVPTPQLLLKVVSFALWLTGSLLALEKLPSDPDLNGMPLNEEKFSPPSSLCPYTLVNLSNYAFCYHPT